MNRNKFYLILSLLLSATYSSLAQENLAYTRFGIGELKSQSFAAQRGFGEIYSAYNSPSDFDINNPASLGFLKFTTFQIGGFVNNSWIKTNSLKESFSDASLDYLSLGFPIIKNHWASSFGLSQFSKANYDIVQFNDSATSLLGQNKNTFNGSGGFYQFYFANGVKVKNFSVGFKLAFLVGTVSYVNTLEFIDTANAYNTRKQESRTAGSLFWSGGAQYVAPLGKKYHLSFGIDGNLSSNVSTKRDLLYERFIYTPSGDPNIAPIPDIKDTTYQVLNQKGNFIIPLQLNGGVILKKEDKFTVGIQGHYGKWSDYRSYGAADSTANNWKISAGGEWIPDLKSLDGYFNRVRYRIGGYFGTNYVQFSGKNFNVYGVTAGFGFPIRHSTSLVNLAFDFGQAGNVKNNLQKQTYLKGTIGFSLNDIWFLKRKYD